MPQSGAEARRRDVLAAIKTPGPETTKRLIGWLRDEDPIVREWAIEGLIGRKDRGRAVQHLIERLLDERADLRWYAARALGKLGVTTPPVREALEAALEDGDVYVRCFAAWALGQLRFPEAIPRLRQRLIGLRIREGKKENEEAFSLGVALMRLGTAPSGTALLEPQRPLFAEAEAAAPSPERQHQRPKTKQQILDEELLKTAEATRIDRAGDAIAVKAKLVTRMQYVRSVTVKEKILAERGPRCQLCGFTFRTKEGTAYAEGHHIKPVSEGGPDDGDNILVLCANHHRELHRADVTWPQGTKRPPEVRINGDAIQIRWQP